ncbi:MAG: histidine phosphatase family protein [Gemmobacter sp.]
MTLRLILIRHAKSSWDDPMTPDHERPLNARGQRAAGLVGDWLVSRGLVPDEVLCSDATRTRETWEGIAARMETPPAPRLTPALYHAGPDVMLAVLKGAQARDVAMIGHNPGIAEFARRIAARPPLAPEFRRYPTGATLVATFAEDRWEDIGWGGGAVADFTFPRALE